MALPPPHSSDPRSGDPRPSDQRPSDQRPSDQRPTTALSRASWWLLAPCLALVFAVLAGGVVLLPRLGRASALGVSALTSETSLPAPTRAVASLGGETTPLPLDTAAVLAEARTYLGIAPRTITEFHAARSAGGPHDYYSEGPYWWPDPDHPEGPYVRRDGERNPDNFDAHRDALGELGDAVTALTAAYLITGEERYARRAVEHLRAWFVTAGTRMNPSLTYAQAIKGIHTGRGIGIIDTVSLIRVAEAARRLAEAGQLTGDALAGVRDWFGAYGTWMTTDPYGIDERDHGNNHSAWWGAQLAAFARVGERDDLLDTARAQYRRQLAAQMAADGTFPEELSRTKPFHYAIYTLDAWATLADIASGPDADLWAYDTGQGTLRRAVDWFVPYLADPSTWPYPSPLEPDPEPHRVDFLIPAAEGYHQPAYRALWERLPAHGERSDPYFIVRAHRVAS